MSASPQVSALLDTWLQARDRCRAQRNKLGLVGYANLAAMLDDKPSTASSLTARAGLGHVAAYRWLMSLHSLGRVHIASWECKAKSPMLPVFAWGPGHDAPAPRVRPNGKPVQAVNLPEPRVCPSVVAWEYLLRSIEAPASRVEVKAATGLDGTTVKEALAALVNLELAHVALWLDRDQGGIPLPQYQLGAGRNVPMPRTKRAERRELLRARQERLRTFALLTQCFNAMAAQAGRT